MGRPTSSADYTARERQLLEGIWDLPWAPANVLHLYLKPVTAQQFRQMRERALSARLIEKVKLSDSGRPGPVRFGLTGRGAAALGVAYRPAWWRSLFLESRRLDPAYWLLSILAAQHEALWAVAPFVVGAEAVRRVYDRPFKEPPTTLATKPRLRGFSAELLTCVQVADQAYVNVLVVVDPGDIRVEWLRNTVLSLQAWRRRPEFKQSPCPYPVVVMVADDAPRLQALLQAWRDVRQAEWDPGPAPALRLITESDLGLAASERGHLDRYPWVNERGQTGPFWTGIFPGPGPSVRPGLSDADWWGQPAAGDADLRGPSLAPLELRPGMRRLGILGGRGPAKRSKGNGHPEGAAGEPAGGVEDTAAEPKDGSAPTDDPEAPKPRSRRRGLPVITAQEWAAAVDNHRAVSPQEHRLLNLVGQYPLATAPDLALVPGRKGKHVFHELRQLAARGLVFQPDGGPGYGLTWQGVTLLALRAGMKPEPYARLRRWTVCHDSAGRPELSLKAWLQAKAHTDIILRFVAGLQRSGPAHDAQLTAWNHLPEMSVDPSGAGARVMPDARGCISLAGGIHEIAFCLEVDLAWQHGIGVRQKLQAYYDRGSFSAGARGRPERLLIVTEAGDEARVQLLRRHFRELDEMYHTRLQVWVVRLDQLEAGYYHLDPYRAVWRTPWDSTGVSPFAGGS